MKPLQHLLALCVTTLALTGAARAQRFDPVQRFSPAQDVGLDQHLGDKLPLDLVFRDESGRARPLSDFFTAKPVLLSFVYFECPMLCTEVLNEQVRLLKALSLEPGRDFEIVTVSIDPKDTPELATKKKQNYINELGRPEFAPAWHFLVGDQEAIRALTSAAGFRYVYDTEQKQFAHAGGVMIVAPGGVLSRYFYGIEYSPRDMRLGLVEAGQGKVGTLVDQLLMMCYHYDPATGRYSVAVMTVARILGVLTVLALITFIVRHALRDSKRAAGSGPAAVAGESR
ncbi:MAG: SCO family protein [Planctomycetes bacterium]|nr:SCO family protein [Planctomycetota bacterium]